ncbi:MAG: agglutinin biogenesis protein, partial [Sulfuritalea sp.]|nr:agglutinin biogenesis protein [Sulfuritalea sp.]
ARRAALQRLHAEVAGAESEIAALGNLLVPPQRMPALLQTLLARHRGLTLVGMTTLPPSPLIAQRAAAGTAAAPGANLYEHGIEIRLAGNYQDLLAYVAELDASSHKLLRGGLSLVVRQHPVSELTLKVYTLSLESTWLVV